MRVGLNPNKHTYIDSSSYIHQILIPVYIPNHEGYYKDSFEILRTSLKSVFNTIHDKTFITIVNNGSCEDVKIYLDTLYAQKKIQELVHTENIGKLNAILKGLVGSNIELVTIADADVFFLTNWQKETVNVFSNIPKAGVVGIVPQFKMYEANSGNVIFDNILNKRMRFLPVKNPLGIERFYESIGWDKSYNKDYLKYTLGLEIDSKLTVLIGSGHFVATYKRDVFKDLVSFIEYKMGGSSMEFLDQALLKKDYWRLTTQDNYAYHMGNTYEEWMTENNETQDLQTDIPFNFPIREDVSTLGNYVKNRVFPKFVISIPFFNKLFLKWKGLPKTMIKDY
ncbi:glycosyltransferase [Tamlana sp. 2201CG12-4]|uniref:glycosyltransferase n=1 Tax=Tamlana sp. 2201CG12-4 TaxID=3112582 RepID=UPI002DBDFA43|nr:glycosyltransferase [Tamlana sp. 2201CG12-4]MEC3907341.1 glycosyltransferase [Tamlana sp. 2201CG12-4]